MALSLYWLSLLTLGVLSVDVIEVRSPADGTFASTSIDDDVLDDVVDIIPNDCWSGKTLGTVLLEETLAPVSVVNGESICTDTAGTDGEI